MGSIPVYRVAFLYYDSKKREMQRISLSLAQVIG